MQTNHHTALGTSASSLPPQFLIKKENPNFVQNKLKRREVCDHWSWYDLRKQKKTSVHSVGKIMKAGNRLIWRRVGKVQGDSEGNVTLRTGHSRPEFLHLKDERETGAASWQCSCYVWTAKATLWKWLAHPSHNPKLVLNNSHLFGPPKENIFDVITMWKPGGTNWWKQ